MRLLVTATLVGLFAWASLAAHAEVVFQDAFLVDGPLVGSTPQTGTGNWTQTGTSTVNPLTIAGGVLNIGTNGQDAYGTFSSAVSATAGTSLFSAFDLSITSAQAGGDYFFHLSNPAGTTSNFYQRFFARSSGSGYQLGISSGSGTGSITTYGSDVLTFGQTIRIVTAWDFVAGSNNDLLSIYVNPTDPVRGNNTTYVGGYSWTGSLAEPTSIAAVNFRQGTATSAPVASIDNLIVATNWGDLTAIPEPSSIVVLGGLGFAGAVRAGRKRMMRRSA